MPNDERCAMTARFIKENYEEKMMIVRGEENIN
jgi:hypothetical protein